MAKQREQQKKDFEERQAKMKSSSSVGLKDMDGMFSTGISTAEEQFRASTVGLVSSEDFKKKREMIELMREKADKEKKKLAKRLKKRKEKERKAKMSSLTFDVEDEEDPEAGSWDSVKKAKLSKDPEADTFFLPDRSRDEEENKLKNELEAKWEALQAKAKSEMIEVTYSYWDGSGHRRTIKVSKGTRMDQFLEKARRDCADSFHELRGISSENLMYIKEDLIIPHHYSFYDLIISKARGKSGPLFHFDVHDDVRMLADASVEKDESHAGKIVTRAYYERNQHIFPVNRWEVYDPNKKWEKYTIK
eukprot:CAMPEP_0175140114 /NCGR_PEP_ID=MMETSP0087-20121206/11282_1 /TAXON_ID=136419 /ORGANISM="Unknown Unknown, Strain D1" /LENGTH=304 /DNA_ID=CAMNT_0016423207 /DNA_START=18 /DNA_END=932 /DNA_ORIENTATION=+